MHKCTGPEHITVDCFCSNITDHQHADSNWPTWGDDE